MQDFMIKFVSPRITFGGVAVENPVPVDVPRGVCAVVGPNGSGKSTVGQVVAKGRYGFGNRIDYGKPEAKVRMLTFTDIHSLTGIDVTRHDQRLESTANDLVPTVQEIMGARTDSGRWRELCDAFALHGAESKRVNYLSSGELRKLLVINALIERPDILVLDNPYIGLDAASRSELDRALQAVVAAGTDTVMLLCDAADVPGYATSVLRVESRAVAGIITAREEIEAFRSRPVAQETEINKSDLPPLRPGKGGFEVAFSIADGHLRYGGNVILEGLDWTVRRGERWALTGPNGSGKSLLLSLVCADHPQAYANRITLFDRRRGTGESIWEIKDRIGYVCPEMQLYFSSDDPVVSIVSAGLRNALSLYRRPTPEELGEARKWLGLFGIGHLAERGFRDLSSGEQRLVLLARTFIRQPELLILDEPLHGLDAAAKERVRRLTDLLVSRNGITLIFVSHYDREIPASVSLTKRLSKHQ